MNKHKIIQDALDLVDEYRFPKSEFLYASLINACGDSNRLDLAEEIFDEMRWKVSFVQPILLLSINDIVARMCDRESHQLLSLGVP